MAESKEAGPGSLLYSNPDIWPRESRTYYSTRLILKLNAKTLRQDTDTTIKQIFEKINSSNEVIEISVSAAGNWKFFVRRPYGDMSKALSIFGDVIAEKFAMPRV